MLFGDRHHGYSDRHPWVQWGTGHGSCSREADVVEAVDKEQAVTIYGFLSPGCFSYSVLLLDTRISQGLLRISDCLLLSQLYLSR